MSVGIAVKVETLPDGVGQVLRDVRVSLPHPAFHGVDPGDDVGSLIVASVAFEHGAPLPRRYTADGAALSPPLHWRGLPSHTTEVVLIVEDADSPTPQPLVHAIVHRLRPGGDGCGALAEGEMSPRGNAPPRLAMGRNSLSTAQWLPPDPPAGQRPHRYAFQVFALEAGAPLPDMPGRDVLCEALLRRAIASGCLIGTYGRPSGVTSGSTMERTPLSPAACPASPASCREPARRLADASAMEASANPTPTTDKRLPDAPATAGSLPPAVGGGAGLPGPDLAHRGRRRRPV